MVKRINGTEQFPFPKRLLQKVRDTPHGSDDECWIWPLYIKDTGYGVTSWYDDGRTLPAQIHRVSWVLVNGPIPDGLTIHHKCYVRACWNPAHLALLSHQENCRDNKWRRTTHCPQGHPYDAQNIDRHGWRICRACRNARERVRQGRLRQERAVS